MENSLTYPARYNAKKYVAGFAVTLLITMVSTLSMAETGEDLWLRYKLIENEQQRISYLKTIRRLVIPGASPTIEIIKTELNQGLHGLLGKRIQNDAAIGDGSLLVCLSTSPLIKELKTSLDAEVSQLGTDGFLIRSMRLGGKKITLVTANTDIGMLYGTYHFLRLLQTSKQVGNLEITESPKISLRLLNHWDNLDRTVERGYAGFSIWDWHKLPDFIDPRYHEYARANASIGINATVLTNVNANALILTPQYLEKVKALADVFRPYGIKVFLTARFSAPIETGKLQTADPLNREVIAWWARKAAEIYQYVPDFGGFLVKANSEGQPGPQNYNRTHADGANMLARAVAPFNGNVIWRAFVYDNNVPVDRTKQSYNEFKPLDGKFDENVLVQVKNGPLDFQPREPFHPLFGAMPATPLAAEFQITQEYLGFSTHLVYLATLFKEVLDADTYARGKNSTVAKVVDGTLENHKLTAISGVANIGTDPNWTGHPIAQANWYSFGRLSWDHGLSPDAIADEWIRMTFSNDETVITPLKQIMMRSRDIAVNYMTPLGLHHIMGWDHHYGPAPWIKDKKRADWTSVYYHRADSAGIGFDRTATGTDALEQYFPEVQRQFSSVAGCPEEFLLWFHRVPWDHRVKSGRNLWEELCYKYYSAADSVTWMQETWESLKGKVDPERFGHVKSLLEIQRKEAAWWRDACVLYFQTFSRKPIPEGLPNPEKSLEYYKSLSFPFAPGIKQN